MRGIRTYWTLAIVAIICSACSPGRESSTPQTDELHRLLRRGDIAAADLDKAADAKDVVRMPLAYDQLREVYLETADLLEQVPSSDAKKLALRELIYWETKLGPLRALQPQSFDLPEIDRTDVSPELGKFLDQVEETMVEDRERIEEWNRKQYGEERRLDAAIAKVKAMRGE